MQPAPVQPAPAHVPALPAPQAREETAAAQVAARQPAQAPRRAAVHDTASEDRSATHDAAVSRLTLVTFGDDAVIDQIIKQSRKLIEVLEIADLTSRDHIETELVIVKIEVGNESLNNFVAALRRHPRAQVIDISAGVRTIEFTGNGAEVGSVPLEPSGLASNSEVSHDSQ